MNVLIVDDKPENLYLLELILKESGYTSIPAANGNEALILAREIIPDLVISDILMPIMDGFTFCCELKKDETLCRIPFIFFTSTYTDFKDEEFALGLGADRFILKPQDPEKLISIIEEVLIEAKGKNVTPTGDSSLLDRGVLKKYSEVLIRKLEDKKIQAEQAEKEVRKYNLALLKEINEHKKAEEALRKSENQYRTFFKTSRDCVFITSNDGHWIDMNDVAFELFGYSSKEELMKTKVTSIYANHEERTKHTTVISENGYTKDYPVDLRKKNGEIIHSLITSAVRYDDNGNAIGFMGTIKDITERKRAEDEIKRANRVYAVLSNINHAIAHIKNIETLFEEACKIAVKDGKFKMAWVGMVDNQTNKVRPVASAGFEENYIKNINIDLLDEKLSGGPTGQAIKTGMHFLANDISSNPEMIPWRSNALQHGYKSSAAFPIKAFDKTVGAIMLYADEKFFFNEVEVKLLDNMAMDISFAIEFNENEIERKRNEDNVRKLNAELEQRVIQRTAQLEAANKELEAFSYSVSHDLRAPLRHASGFAELLITKCKSDLPEKGLHYLNSIIDSVHQMGILIDELLQFSRTGRAELRNSVSDMNLLIIDVIEFLSKDNSDRIIGWSVEKLPTVMCDNSMMKLVWMNLLSNAVKFTKVRQEARIEIGVYDKGNEFVFFVRDNGVGFDMKYAQKLFGVFQRLHSIEEFEGTGIGLANVRRIILRHAGRTWAEAEPDKGATFYFTLPKIIEEAS